MTEITDQTFALIPVELTDRPQWVVWKLETNKKGKPTKVPYNAQAGRKASSTDPATWATLDRVIAAYQTETRWNGIGYVFTPDDPYAGVDLDAAPDQTEWIERFDSYSERSPSGEGVHIIVRGSMPDGKGRKSGDYEAYSQAHFFTVTGQHISGTPLVINPRQEVLDEFIAARFPAEVTANGHRPATIDNLSETPAYGKLSRLLVNDEQFYWLYTHKRKLEDSSLSGYDMALANVAVQAGLTDGEIVWLINQHRDKHGDGPKHTGYYERTIAKARVPLGAPAGGKHGDPLVQLQMHPALADLPAEITGVRKLGLTGGRYQLMFSDGRHAELGPAGDVLTPSKVQDTIGDILGQAPDLPSRKRWLPTANLILTIGNENAEDLGDDPQTECKGWLAAMTAGCPPGYPSATIDLDDAEQKAHTAGTFNKGRAEMNSYAPVVGEGCWTWATDGCLIIHALGFARWVQSPAFGARTSSRDVIGRLKRLGFTSYTIQGRNSLGKNVAARTWMSPHGFDPTR